MSLADIYAANSYWINPSVGAVLSLSLFALNYRRTISARKERATHAHVEVIKILVRNLLDLCRVLTPSEINHILQTKARENKIKISDMPDEMSCVFALQSRIAEDEMVGAETKKELLNKIQAYIDENEKANPQLTEEPQTSAKLQTSLSKNLTYVSILAAISGITLFFILNYFSGINNEVNVSNIIAVMTTIIVIISLLVSFQWLYEKSTSTLSSSTTMGIDFENQIYRSLGKMGKIEKEPLIPGVKTKFDFLLSTKSDKFLIETKSFRSYIPTTVITLLNEKANEVKIVNKNYKLVLIVNEKKFLAKGYPTLQSSWDYVIDRNDLPSFLSQIRFQNERALRQR